MLRWDVLSESVGGMKLEAPGTPPVNVRVPAERWAAARKLACIIVDVVQCLSCILSCNETLGVRSVQLASDVVTMVCRGFKSKRHVPKCRCVVASPDTFLVSTKSATSVLVP